MKSIGVMIKPASSLCNMRCRYCFYADVAHRRTVPSFGIMQEDVVCRTLDGIFEALSAGDRLTIAFQGGESTLAGLDFFRNFTDEVNKRRGGTSVAYALQTNGISLDDAWCVFLKENRFLVGVSCDILKDSHDETRKDTEGIGTFARTVRGIEALKEIGVPVNVLCTLTAQVARHPQKVWKAILRHGFDHVQFTPCLDDLEAHGSRYALHTEAFGQFYDVLFPLWLNEYRQGHYVSVKLFDDLVNYLAFGAVNACGLNGKCQPQLVVEADGSVYPCDFYCTDEHRLGSFGEIGLEALFLSSAIAPCKQGPMPPLCGTCEYHAFCGGGCRRMRGSAWCGMCDSSCGMRTFLLRHMPELQWLAARQRK